MIHYFQLHCMCVFINMCLAALLDIKQHRKIHLDTEVWSWGSGDHGQLGHADLLNRLLSLNF